VPETVYSEYFAVFPGIDSQLPPQYLKVSHDHFLPYLLQFAIIVSRFMIHFTAMSVTQNIRRRMMA
jgi:hypothetical protein